MENLLGVSGGMKLRVGRELKAYEIPSETVVSIVEGLRE